MWENWRLRLALVLSHKLHKFKSINRKKLETNCLWQFWKRFGMPIWIVWKFVRFVRIFHFWIDKYKITTSARFQTRDLKNWASTWAAIQNCESLLLQYFCITPYHEGGIFRINKFCRIMSFTTLARWWEKYWRQILILNIWIYRFEFALCITILSLAKMIIHKGGYESRPTDLFKLFAGLEENQSLRTLIISVCI